MVTIVHLSTSHHLTITTSLNTSPSQHLSTPHHHNISQHLNTSPFQHLSTPQHLNISTPQHHNNITNHD
ncbi:hypothetical protein [Leyella stercorea]|uniref:hypothetical protein n=1 Tax=Leyella stercorea TaxID=363265 RepID=UPI0024311F2F|nr:hypothetical protein [Leyella stercorea]